MRTPQKYLDRGIIYQLFLRAFTNEGTLKEAEKLLPHIRETADIIYITACFKHDQDQNTDNWSERQNASGLNNPSNPYRMSDYYSIDPEYGTNDDLKSFVASAHKLGLKVILDLVYFHCGPNAVFIAEHPDFIVRNADGTPDLGYWHFPKLNYQNPELREYLIRNMELYVRDYGVDGYRCDVGDSIPLDFWAEARARIDAINPELMMLNEGTNSESLEVYDLNYSWSIFRDAITAIVKGEKPASALGEALEEFNQKHLAGTHHAMLCLDNHDTANDDYDNRLEARIGSKAMDAAFVVNYLLPYVPFVYNGTEIADANRHSIWGNRFYSANLTIDWQKLTLPEGQRRLTLLKKLTALRHGLPEVGLEDRLEFIKTDSDKVVAFVRGENDRTAVLANFSDKRVRVSTELGAGELEPWLLSGAAISLAGAEGRLTASLEPFGFAVIELH